jgi:hypothetical protein
MPDCQHVRLLISSNTLVSLIKLQTPNTWPFDQETVMFLTPQPNVTRRNNSAVPSVFPVITFERTICKE